MAKLSRLYLQNYRNIPEWTINFDGRDGKIVGANRIGKTNCIEAICYLLTDKLLGGSADIPSIKRHDDTRAKVVVEGTFYTDEGEVTLRKEFYEKWVRPRGSATEELAGHSTDYYINGAKQNTARDFFNALESKFGIPKDINGIDAYQLVIDPFFMGENVCGSLDWKKARKLIIDIVGDVTPEEICERNKDASIALEDLKAHQFDDAEAKKAIRGEIDGYKKKMVANQGLLDEYRRALDADVTDEEHGKAQRRLDEINELIAKLKFGSSNPYEDEVTSLQAELYELQQEYGKTATAVADHTASNALVKEVYAKNNELAEAERQRNMANAHADSAKWNLDGRKAKQAEYKTRLAELKEQSLSIVVDENCPTCGQKLPQDRIEQAFNKKKAEILAEAERIRNLALENKKEIEALTDEYLRLTQRDFDGEIAKLKLEYTELNKRLTEARAKEEASVPKPDPKIQERIGEINTRLSLIRSLQAQGNEGSQKQIQDLRSEKESLQATFSKRIAADNARKRMAEIAKDNVEVGKKQADAEQRHWAVGEYVKTKLQLLDEHMASKLGEARFQLIKDNIKSGSYDEVCVPYIICPATGKHTETLFPDGSKSEQIYTGCQIIKAIRDAKGWSPLPVLFDQGGELDVKSTEKVAYDAEAQVIAVKVEGENKKPAFVPFAN